MRYESIYDDGGQAPNRTGDASFFRAALYLLSYLAMYGGSGLDRTGICRFSADR